MIQKLQDSSRRLLRWSETYFKGDMAYLMRGASWLTVGQITSSGLSLLVAIVCANLLTKDTYGLYKYMLSIANLLSIFALPGMVSALTRSVARGFEGSIVPATKTSVSWSILGSVVGCVVAVYYYAHGNTTLALALLIIALLLPLFDSFTSFTAYYLGKSDFRGSVTANAITQGGATLAVISAVLLKGNIFALLLAYFGSYSVLNLAYYLYTVRKIAPDASVDPEVISYGKHLSVMSILGTVAANIDKLVLFHILGPVEVAIYSVTTAAPDQLKSVVGFLTTLLFPKFAQGDEVDAHSKMRHTFFLFSIASVAAVITYVSLAPLFFHIFFRQYQDVVFLSQIFSLSLLTMALDPATIFLSARGKVKEQYWANTMGYLLQIGGVIILAMYFGLVGVIAARIITRFVGNAINVYFYYHPFKT